MTTDTVMRSIPADLLARMDEIGEDRPIGSIQPGWWIRCVRDDNNTREWVYVVMWLHGKGVSTGRIGAQLYGISPDEPDCLIDTGIFYAEQPICCITKAQAKKLGLTDPRKSAAEEARQ